MATHRYCQRCGLGEQEFYACEEVPCGPLMPQFIVAIERQLECEAAMERYLLLKKIRPDFGFEKRT